MRRTVGLLVSPLRKGAQCLPPRGRSPSARCCKGICPLSVKRKARERRTSPLPTKKQLPRSPECSCSGCQKSGCGHFFEKVLHSLTGRGQAPPGRSLAQGSDFAGKIARKSPRMSPIFDLKSEGLRTLRRHPRFFDKRKSPAGERTCRAFPVQKRGHPCGYPPESVLDARGNYLISTSPPTSFS